VEDDGGMVVNRVFECTFVGIETSTINTRNGVGFKVPFWVFLVIGALYFCAVRVDIMDIDASQYAEISREMARSGDFLNVYDRGMDYLDKPPFLFWVTSISIKLFGATNFAYRLPSILFAFLAIYATYRLARLLYGENIARIAALVLASCQGLFLWTNDVRTDTILMSCVATALWCIRECENGRRWYYVLGGTVAIACGLMTKGPIALFVVLFAFGCDWVLRRKWKLLFSPWHLLDAAIIALLLVPMSIGLYQQFDMHPEKLIDGVHGTSGLRFFYWTQSFGRITGESSWENGADPSFLLQSMLWAFLPWMFLFLAALIINMRDLVRQRFKLRDGQEWLTTGGFILTYLSLCISRYQLPHYIFVAFPFAAIMVGKLLGDFISGEGNRQLYGMFKWVQIISTALLLVGVLLILTVVFPAGWIGILLWCGAVGVWLYLLLRKGDRARILWISAGTMILVNLFVTNHFYYRLLQYQMGSQVGKYIREKGIPEGRVMSWKAQDPLACIDYYAQQIVTNSEDYPAPGKAGDYVLTAQCNLASYDSAGRGYSVVKEGRFFKVSELTPQFLNYRTRDSATGVYSLILLR
jgi:4-amino-4-deoxy-L-arabinose transferase-like glycosyltransferase